MIHACYDHVDNERTGIDDVDVDDDIFWNIFTQLTTKLRSLKLLHFFADHAVAEVAHRKVM